MSVVWARPRSARLSGRQKAFHIANNNGDWKISMEMAVDIKFGAKNLRDVVKIQLLVKHAAENFGARIVHVVSTGRGRCVDVSVPDEVAAAFQY